jgi:hypothetical protein
MKWRLAVGRPDRIQNNHLGWYSLTRPQVVQFNPPRDINASIAGLTTFYNTWIQTWCKYTNGTRGLNEKVEVKW